METIGSLLKQEREKQNKSLNDIAKATRISKMVLESIEAGRSDRLLPTSYVRGFLRLYAEALGMNPAEVIQRYNGQVDDGQKWGAQKELKGPVSAVAAHPGTWIGFAVALVLCTALYLVMNGSGPGDATRVSIPKSAPDVLPDRGLPQSPAAPPLDIQAADEPEAPPVSAEPAAIPAAVSEVSEQVAAAAPAEKPPEPSETLSEPSETLSEPSETLSEPSETLSEPAAVLDRFMVRFEAREMIWSRISADDEDPFEVTLRPGEIYRTSAVRKLNVRLGNPGGVALFFNDNPVELTGDPTAPVNLTFPRDAGQVPQAQ